MSARVRQVVMVVCAIAVSGPLTAAQSVPVPRPFPGSGTPPAPTRPAAPSAPAETAPVTSAPLPAEPSAPAGAQPRVADTPAVEVPNLGDVPVYPTAEYLDSYDAGRGQRYHLFGSNVPFATIVAYYKQQLRDGGREISKSPGVQQFELERFRSDRMAYPPSVVVKDYSSGTPQGYLFVTGTTAKRYATLIQVVPPQAPEPR